jgi:hypothetical protein
LPIHEHSWVVFPFSGVFFNVCSFHCRVISSPWLSLYLVFFWGGRLLRMELFSWFLSQLVHCWYITKLLSFAYWLYIVLVFVRSRSVLVESVQFLKMGIIWLFFLFWIPFISFPCLIGLARNFIQYWKRYGRMDILVLFLSLREWFLFFPI